MIAEGRVEIDGAIVRDPGRKIEPGQVLRILDAPQGADEKLTILLHKPVGYVSGQPEPGRVPAARLLTAANAVDAHAPAIEAGRIFPPVGRLDLDSRGLLILSDDGVVAKAVIGPDSRIDKEYLVAVEGPLDDRKIARLRHGLTLDGRLLKPAGVERIGLQNLRFTLTEGRNRQIPRVCECVGLLVVDLLRERIGPIELGDLAEGRWRTLRPDERAALLRANKQ